MEALRIPELTNAQIEELCLIAEKAAREHVLSKVPSKKIVTLDISAEAKGAKPVALKVDVVVTLLPSMKDFDVQKLADEAVKEAFISAEKHLREIACHSQK
ncbi:MAG TPA: DUF3194 domain-containing protein [candidate division Zixibacteria bacterium]|nr:DUF3194 domain-containing protein [candidate division Zixibacteria bacterium]